MPLSNADKVYAKECRVGHNLEKYLSPPSPTQELVVLSKQEVGPYKKARLLPTTDDEREAAYISALDNMSKFFIAKGFESYVSDSGALMVGKGNFLLDAKVTENDGRTAYVTSSPTYNPLKAGTRESKATIITTRTLMKARRILRVAVNGGAQTVPIFIELRKNIQDPELHICKSIMFVLETAMDQSTSLGKNIRDRTFMKDVPAEWLPSPGDYDALFGIDHPPVLE